MAPTIGSPTLNSLFAPTTKPMVRDKAGQAALATEICGLAFDPHVSEEARRYGRLTILPARMNADLLMGAPLLVATGVDQVVRTDADRSDVLEPAQLVATRRPRGAPSDGDRLVGT